MWDMEGSAHKYDALDLLIDGAIGYSALRFSGNLVKMARGGKDDDND